MESRVNYTIVGFFVLVLGAGIVMLGFWMTAGTRSKAYDTYLVYMNETVSGLSDQAAVKFNGDPVGYVKKIELNHNNPQQVILTLQVEQGTPVTTSTYAILQAQGITGIAYMGLSAKNATGEPLRAKPGQKYPVIPSQPSLFTQLDTVLREVSGNIKDISNSFKNVFDQQNTKAITDSLRNIDKFTQMLADNSDEFEEMLASARTLMKNSSKASQRFPQIATKLEDDLRAIKIMSGNISEAGKQAGLTMRSARRALHTLREQALPPATNLIHQLNAAAGNIKILSKQLKQNPAMLVRGKVPAVLGPGEK